MSMAYSRAQQPVSSEEDAELTGLRHHHHHVRSFNKNNDKRIVTVKTKKNKKKTSYNAVTSTNVCTAAE